MGPAREGDEKIAEAINGVASQLRNLLTTVQGQGSAGLADKKLTVIEGILNGTEKKNAKTENRYLRLQFDGQYDNGDPYKDYVLLMDAPRIPATRTVVEGTRHAIKGDLDRSRVPGERKGRWVVQGPYGIRA